MLDGAYKYKILLDNTHINFLYIQKWIQNWNLK